MKKKRRKLLRKLSLELDVMQAAGARAARLKRMQSALA